MGIIVQLWACILIWKKLKREQLPGVIFWFSERVWGGFSWVNIPNNYRIYQKEYHYKGLLEQSYLTILHYHYQGNFLLQVLYEVFSASLNYAFFF